MFDLPEIVEKSASQEGEVGVEQFVVHGCHGVLDDGVGGADVGGDVEHLFDVTAHGRNVRKLFPC